MFGIIARVGSVNGQRVTIITDLVRAEPDDPSETTLQTAVVRQTAETLADDEIPVFDAGFLLALTVYGLLEQDCKRSAELVAADLDSIQKVLWA